MRFKTAVCAGVVAALACTSAGWAALSDDVYSSIDGSLKAARLTQSETENEGVDQVFSIASWNGTTLGSEWQVSCNVQREPADVVVGLDGSGNGVVTTTIMFRGGTFRLDQAGPWGRTTGHLTGKVLHNLAVLTEYYLAGQVVSADMVSQVSGVARLGHGPKMGRNVSFEFRRCTAWGEMEGSHVNYPELVDQECLPTRAHGYWGDMADVAIRVSKPVVLPELSASPTDGDAPTPVEPTTWGELKVRYR